MRHAAIALVLAAAAASSLVAQAPAPRPAFEVASIKPSDSLSRGGGSGWQPGGRYRGTNIPGTMLVRMAYGTMRRMLLGYQLEGAPGWLASARYDIVGRIRTDLIPPTPAELFSSGPQFLQSLLADRFRLQVHHESRQLQRYRLVRARNDGMLGSRLRRSAIDCAATPDNPGCKLEYLPGHLIFTGVVIGRFADDLSGSLSRIIVDDTGLTGPFDIDVEWSPDQSATDKPSIFTAVQEQLGLRLEPGRGPVDVVVIDRVEKPSED